jgi:DNA-binding beta-propeller fold protein YncE
LAAALSIARNPALVSVAGVNDVATKAALFSPALASAPNDWSMPLNFAPTGSNFNTPIGVAIDSSGRVWVTNFDGNNVTALNNDGTLFGNFAAPGSNFFGPGGVAFDSSGNLWVPNGGDNTVTELVGVAAPVLTPMVACLKQATPALRIAPGARHTAGSSSSARSARDNY